MLVLSSALDVWLILQYFGAHGGTHIAEKPAESSHGCLVNLLIPGFDGIWLYF